MSAVGIHDHERYKLGLVPHAKTKEQLLQIRWAVDPASVAPVEVNHMTVPPGLDGNDKYGDCGPTSADNIQRIITKYETGAVIAASEAQVLELYAQSSSPSFNPKTGANDDGVENPTLYAAWVKNGLAGQAGPIAYGQLEDTSDASLALALEVFGAATMAVNLEKAQQSQSDGEVPVWDYLSSPEWGGHDVCIGAISGKTGLVTCYSWAMAVGMTPAFRQHQMLEVFVPVFASVVASDKFDATVDRVALSSDFQNLTGKTLPNLPAPTPQPPTPGSSLSLSLTDPAVVRHIKHAAGSVDPSVWATKHFHSYFKIGG